MNLSRQICLIVCCLIVLVPRFNFSETNNVGKSLWSDLIEATQQWSRTQAQQLGQDFQQLARNANISMECNASVVQTLEAFSRLEDWAHKMYNSWAKFPPSGLLEGTSSDFGAYDQCLSIEPNEVMGRAQYCMIDLSLPLPQPQPMHHNLHHKVTVIPKDIESNSSVLSADNLFTSLSAEASFFYWVSIRTAICVPNKCSQNDINSLINQFVSKHGLWNKSVRCETKDKQSLNYLQIIAIIIIGLFVISGVAATIIEYVMPVKHKSFLVEIFSINKNLTKLLSPQTSDNLSCLHGIRVLTIFWVVFGHTLVWVHFQTFSRSFRIKDILTTNVNQLVLNVEYGVDTIFFISGLLTTYITLSITRGKLSNFNYLGFLLSRVIRLSPQLFLFLLLNFLLPLTGSGPVWHESIDTLMDKCYKNWWLNLLYVQNFVEVKNMCAHHTWYMACDMQFHLVSLFVIVAFLRNTKLGVMVNLITILIFTLISSIIIYMYNLPPAIVNTARDQYFQDYYVELFYYKPWPHAIIFFFGVAFGFIVYRRKFFQLQKKQFYLVWAVILVCFWIPLMDDSFWNQGQPYNPIISAFYYPFCRIVWAFCVASLIWCCLSGNGGLINKFLSWRPFVPMARLTYSVYLTHAWTVWIFYGTRRERIDLSSYSLSLIFLHNLVLSYIIGLFFAVIFEMPILRVNKYLLKYFGPVKDKERYCEGVDKSKTCFTGSLANNNLIISKTIDFEEEEQTTL